MSSSPTASHPHDEKESNIDPNGSLPSLSGNANRKDSDHADTSSSTLAGYDTEGRKLYGGASIIPMVSCISFLDAFDNYLTVHVLTPIMSLPFEMIVEDIVSRLSLSNTDNAFKKPSPNPRFLSSSPILTSPNLPVT